MNQHKQRGQYLKNLINQYRTTQCPQCGRHLIYSNESISALVQCCSCNNILAATNPLNLYVNSESLTSTPSWKKPDEKVVHSEMQTKDKRTSTILAPKLTDMERIAMNKTVSVPRIEVGRSKASFHIVLTIIIGMTVGLFVTLLLKLIGN